MTEEELKKGYILHSRYRIERKLESGGMGTIYEATDLRLNASVAIKENRITGEYRKKAFRREAQFLANLDHPSLPHVMDYFVDNGTQYLVMRLIEGLDLATLIAQRRKGLPIESVEEVARQLLDVLVYLHGQPVPVLHRDIKPANVKIWNGFVFLLDFGLAYGQSGEMSTLISTPFNWEGHSPNYASPEQLKCETTSATSDLFSLAATLYVLLTGVPPVNAARRTKAISRGEPDPLRDPGIDRPDLDKNFTQAIMRGLALDPNDRPQSANEMRDLLFPPIVHEFYVPPPRSLATRRAFVAAVLGLVTLVGAAWFYGTAVCEKPVRLFGRTLLPCKRQPESLAIDKPARSNEQLAQLRLEAEQLLESGRYEESIKKAKEVISQSPDDNYARLIYADAFCDAQFEKVEAVDQLPEAQEQARLILAPFRSPETAEDYTARAWAHLMTKKPDLAIVDATEALRLKPGFISALMIRATAKSIDVDTASKHALESLADYDEVIKLRPDYVVAWANRAATLARLGHHRLAISDFAEAVRLMPRASFHFGRGASFFNLREYDNARSEYKQALKINRTFYPAQMGLAEIDFVQENWLGAITNYTSTIKIRPTAAGYYGRGVAYSQIQRFGDAIHDFSRAIKLEPRDFRSYGLRGYAYGQMSNWKDAISDYTKSLGFANDGDSDFLRFVYENRAEAFRRNGKKQLAQSDEQSARALSTKANRPAD